MIISSLESSFVRASSTGSEASFNVRASLRWGCSDMMEALETTMFLVPFVFAASGWDATGLRDLILTLGLSTGSRCPSVSCSVRFSWFGGSYRDWPCAISFCCAIAYCSWDFSCCRSLCCPEWWLCSEECRGSCNSSSCSFGDSLSSSSYG